MARLDREGRQEGNLSYLSHLAYLRCRLAGTQPEVIILREELRATKRRMHIDGVRVAYFLHSNI